MNNTATNSNRKKYEIFYSQHIDEGMGYDSDSTDNDGSESESGDEMKVKLEMGYDADVEALDDGKLFMKFD